MAQHTAPARDALARNLRRLRVARRWSLSDLAAAADAGGKATLSAIENGRANPTVDTLAALAAALDVEVTALLEAAPEDEVTLVRAGEGDASSDGMVRLGAADAGELHRGRFEPRSTVVARPRPGGARVHVLVTRGTLVVGPVERIVELAAGDYLSFPADRPYEFNTARSGASALILLES
jgi:transcriptional regulator with XRE-family HTH domain